MIVGDIYKTITSGDIEIIEYRNAKSIKVKFLITGYEVVTCSANIKRGNIKDYIKASVYGVGFIGVGIHIATVNGKMTLPYSRWRGMLSRCYSDLYQSKKPTYKGCYVCDEWHNYQNFADWFDVNYIKGFELDKDKLGNGKLYSPKTCCFINRAENVEISQSKRYVLKYKDGTVKEFFNLSKFCRENGLTSANIHKVLNKTRGHHKGWSLP